MRQTYNTLGAARPVQRRQPAAVFGINTSSIQQQQLSYLGFSTERRSMQGASLLRILHIHTVAPTVKQNVYLLSNHLHYFVTAVTAVFQFILHAKFNVTKQILKW